MGAALAAMVVEVVGHNAPAILKLNPKEPWEKVAVAVIEQVTTGLADTLNNLDAGHSLKPSLQFFSNKQLIALGRVILTQVSHTPGMLGVGRSEVQSIFAGMAQAMAADDNLLLSADEWIKIAGVAAQKAAANPGRLFGLSADDQSGALAVTVIKSVLAAAGNTWTEAGRADHPLLFGETLKSALEIVIAALAGNISALANQPDLVDLFLQDLLTRASQNPEKFGSDGLLKVFRALIGNVLANGTLPQKKEIDDALSA